MTSCFIIEFWKFLNNIAVTFRLNWFQILKTHTRIPLHYWRVIFQIEREKIPRHSSRIRSSFKHRNNPLAVNKITRPCREAKLHSDYKRTRDGAVCFEEREQSSILGRRAIFPFVTISKIHPGLPTFLSLWLQTIKTETTGIKSCISMSQYTSKQYVAPKCW